MAGQTKQIIRNKPLYNGVSLDMERTETFGASRWALFKSVLFGRFGTVVLANLLSMIFALPGMAVLVLFYVNSSVAMGLVPYSGNIGFGITVTVDAAAIGASTAFSYLSFEMLLLIPCIAVFALGVAGNMYVINRIAAGEEVHTFKDFFRGIKRCGLSFFFLGLLFAVVLASVVLSVDFFDVYGLGITYKVLSLVVSILIICLFILFLAFFMTQSAAFKMPLGARIRNSFLFMLGTNVQSIVFVGIAIAPIFLIFLPGILMLYIMLYVLLGVSYTTAVLTVYCRGCYEKYTEGKTAEAKQTSYAKRDDIVREDAKRDEDKRDADGDEIKSERNDDADQRPEEKSDGTVSVEKPKKKPTQYKNPKKRKPSNGGERRISQTRDAANDASTENSETADNGTGSTDTE